MNRLAPLALIVAVLLTLSPSEAQPAKAATVLYVTTDALNVRMQPSLAAPVVTRVYGGDRVSVTNAVNGPAILGDTTWYRTTQGYYLAGAYLSSTPPASASPAAGGAGRWIDVNLSTLQVRAMAGDRMIYTAPATTGKPGWETPTGRFSILWRVWSMDMDAASIGVPRSSPQYYYQPDVPYTQLFTYQGDAIHGNYWSPADSFGNYNTSHGCVGLRNADAAYFWQFGYVGMPVIVHY